jgi:hypothetical protein
MKHGVVTIKSRLFGHVKESTELRGRPRLAAETSAIGKLRERIGLARINKI